MDEDHNDVVEIEGERTIGMGGEMGSLELKLQELRRKKEELAACQQKIDEDIQAVKRTMELVASV